MLHTSHTYPCNGRAASGIVTLVLINVGVLAVRSLPAPGLMFQKVFLTVREACKSVVRPRSRLCGLPCPWMRYPCPFGQEPNPAQAQHTSPRNDMTCCMCAEGYQPTDGDRNKGCSIVTCGDSDGYGNPFACDGVGILFNAANEFSTTVSVQTCYKRPKPIPFIHGCCLLFFRFRHID